MSAAFRVGWLTRRSTGFLAGCLRLGCGTTLGRNRLANRARIAELLGVRLNLLEIRISFYQLRRKALQLHTGFAARLMASLISLFFFCIRPS
jgi:hypothetical protein